MIKVLSTRLKEFVRDLRSTNWIIYTGTEAGLLTAVVYLAGIMLERHPEALTFGMWLGFLGSWIGFGVKQFRVKRETHRFDGPQEGDANAPVQ